MTLSRDSRDKAPILVSACLLGVECRFDGGSKPRDILRRLAAEGRALPVCPEQLGGLPTPRPPAEILGGGGDEVLGGQAAVLDSEGRDVSAEFLSGARRSLELARLFGCRKAVLKERSPSCGLSRLRAGEDLIEGRGVAAALLVEEGIEAVSDEYPDLQGWIHED